MRWLLGLALATGAMLAIAAVVVAIASVRGPGDVERIKSALRLQTNCAHITIRRPSRAPVVERWAASTVQTADIRCRETNARVIYAKFIDHDRLDRALAASEPTGRYCLLGNAILIDRLVMAPSTVLSDMCQSLGGQVGAVPAT